MLALCALLVGGLQPRMITRSAMGLIGLAAAHAYMVEQLVCDDEHCKDCRLDFLSVGECYPRKLCRSVKVRGSSWDG